MITALHGGVSWECLRNFCTTPQKYEGKHSSSQRGPLPISRLIIIILVETDTKNLSMASEANMKPIRKCTNFVIPTQFFLLNQDKSGLRPARPRIGLSGQDSAWLGTFWGFLNVSLCASAAQLGLHIVDQMWVQFRIGSWGFTLFQGGYQEGPICFPPPK